MTFSDEYAFGYRQDFLENENFKHFAKNVKFCC